MSNGRGKVVRKASAQLINVKGGTILDYPSKDSTDALGVAVASISGNHGPTVNSKCARAYYILSGAGTIRLDGDAYKVVAGDVVVIPQNVVHEVVGVLEYVVINAPTFDPAYESKPGESVTA